MSNYTTEISIVWQADDVLSQDPDLTPQQVGDVLDYLKHNHDACLGINWDVIDYVISIIKTKP